MHRCRLPARLTSTKPQQRKGQGTIAVIVALAALTIARRPYCDVGEWRFGSLSESAIVRPYFLARYASLGNCEETTCLKQTTAPRVRRRLRPPSPPHSGGPTPQSTKTRQGTKLHRQGKRGVCRPWPRTQRPLGISGCVGSGVRAIRQALDM